MESSVFDLSHSLYKGIFPTKTRKGNGIRKLFDFPFVQLHMSKKKKQIEKLNEDSVEVFIEFLNQIFKHIRSEDLSFEIWKTHVQSSPKLAERWLVSFHELLKSPPPDFEHLLIKYGDLRFMHDFDLPTERDFTEEEVLAWAKVAYLKFANYFFENTSRIVGDYLSV
jgi:hypothetical protein